MKGVNASTSPRGVQEAKTTLYGVQFTKLAVIKAMLQDTGLKTGLMGSKQRLEVTNSSPHFKKLRLHFLIFQMGNIL